MLFSPTWPQAWLVVSAVVLALRPVCFLRKLRLQKNSEMLTEDNGEREGK
jgi:hypothetical protein